MREITIAPQVLSGFWWRSEDQVACLSHYLEGKALRYFETQSPVWMREQPQIEYVMTKMNRAYGVHLTMEQAVTIFQRPKPKKRSWGEHYIYLVEVSHAGGGISNLV